MAATFEKKEKNTVFFNIEISPEEFEKGIQKVYLETRSRFSIPGFRKGKVPRQIIEMNYGKEVFYEDALNELLPEHYEKAIEELELEPVDRPHIDVDEIKKDQPVLVKIHVDVKPEVELGDYSTIEIEKVEYEVTDEMVDNEVTTAQNQNSRMVDVSDRAVKEGDILTIDYAGFNDGEQFPGGTAQDQQLEIGSNAFIPGFEEQLIGKNKDEEVEVNVTFPEEYQEESLQGKDVTFNVTIKEIKEKELPELDDEFAKDVSEFDTLEEYKNSIKERLEDELAKQEEVETENKVVEKAVELSEVDVPQGMIEAQVENELNDFGYRLQMQGLNLEQYLELTGSDAEGMKDQFRPMAEKRVSSDLVLEAIAEKEKIEVSDEDIDEELNLLADQYNQEDKDKFIEDMKKGDLDFLKAGIKNKKVIEILKENIKYIEN